MCECLSAGWQPALKTGYTVLQAASLRYVLQAASLRWVLWVVALVVVAGWQPALRGVGELVAFRQRV